MAGERILVVDDEPMLRKLLADTLALEDFEVITAEDAESALNLMERRSFDAAVLDIMMPKVTGIELLKRIREINKELPVIILTAYASKESAIEALRLGAHDYLEKPPERERLIHSIRKGIERRRLREENATLVKELQERAERLKLISQMGAAVTSTLEMNKVLAMALEMSRRAVGAKTCLLFVFDEDEKELICRIAQGVGKTRESQKTSFINTKLSDLPVCFQEIADLTIQKKNAVFISDAKKDPRFFSLSDSGWDVNSIISVPLLLRDKVLGAIQVINKADGKRFTKADEVFTKLTANFVSVALENAKLTAKLEETMAQLADYSKILEEKVKERTKELIEANEALEKANRSLKEMQDRMVQSEKLASIGQLSAGIAHEINNPLGSMSSHLNTLRDYLNGLLLLVNEYEKLESAIGVTNGISPSVNALLQGICSLKEKVEIDYLKQDVFRIWEDTVLGVDKIKVIVGSLRRFSHTKEEEKTLVDINKIINDALVVTRNQLKYKADIKISLGEVPLILGNSTRLYQVFTNILINAGQAIEKWGTIEIATFVKDGKVCALFRDTGCGIPKENMKRIFDPFFTTKEVGVGTGLGLSIAYGVVQSLGGEIEVESEVGKGSTFTVVLPIKQNEKEGNSSV